MLLALLARSRYLRHHSEETGGLYIVCVCWCVVECVRACVGGGCVVLLVGWLAITAEFLAFSALLSCIE